MATKSATMADLLKTAEKKYNLNVGPLSSIASDTKFISTGNIAIDTAVGGGVPLCRSIEFFGPPSSGKTTLAVQAAVHLQRIILAGGNPELGIGPNDKIIYLDYEQAFDASYAVALGLDPDHSSFLFSQPDTLEDGANFLLAAFETGEVRFAIIDSIAAMTPSAKAEAEIGKSLPAVQAKLMKDFGANLNPVLRHNNGMVIFINHEMEVMDMGAGRRPGMPAATTTPGGRAPKFFASVRLQFRPMRQIKGTVKDPLTLEDAEIPVATDVKVKVVKNKVAPPFREAIVRVRYGKGFDEFWTAMQILLASKKVIYNGGLYYFHNIIEEVPADWMTRDSKGTKRPYIKGEKNVFAYGDKKPEWRQALIDLAAKVAEENKDALHKVAKLGVSEEVDEEDDLDADLDAELAAQLEELFPTGEQKGHRASL